MFVLLVAVVPHAPLYCHLGTPQGRLKGLLHADTGQRQFRGIPYAEPPVGDRRWRPALPKLSWAGELDATRYSDPCWQNPASAWTTVQGLNRMSEDCLYVNVVAPAPSGTAAPVLL